jgi:hypothetical protein
MSRRRVRASLLLRIVILGACLALFALAVFAAASGPAKLAILVFLAGFWLLAIELDLLPTLIEHVVVQRASRRERAPRSRWFVDVEAEDRRRTEELREGARDNPALH